MAMADDILRKVADLYGIRLYWHIRRIVVSHDDAEDALQETFIKVFSKASDFSGNEQSLEAWCYRIATNEALQCLRKRKKLFQSFDALGDELSGLVMAESAPDADKSSILFQQALMNLSINQRIVFNLRYYDELPFSQIAEMTGKSENSLRTNYHYAVNKVKEYLKNHEV